MSALEDDDGRQGRRGGLGLGGGRRRRRRDGADAGFGADRIEVEAPAARAVDLCQVLDRVLRTLAQRGSCLQKREVILIILPGRLRIGEGPYPPQELVVPADQSRPEGERAPGWRGG